MPLNQLVYEQTIAGYSGSDLVAGLPAKLLSMWHDDYIQSYPRAQLVEVNLDSEGSSFTYLFDIGGQRNIAAVGIPAFVKHKRDAARMAGHPLSEGSDFHRGHLMAHSIGGGADINLVPQLARLNIGQFRILERLVRGLAQQSVRCLYFVRTLYPDATSQLPSYIEQAAIEESGALHYAMHSNS